MMNTYLCLVIFLAFITKCEQKYVIPDITIAALKPKGLIVSLPDSKGVQQFAFHANINQPIRGKEDGTISREVGFAENGIWKIRDPNIQLKVGDVLNYWLFVQQNRLGFDKQEQKFTVTELVEEGDIKPPAPPCTDSITKINGGQSVCGNTKIFEDTFDSFDESKWRIEQYVPWGPDFEFNTYENKAENWFIDEGILNLKATIRDNPMSPTPIDLTTGCTGSSCTFQAVGTLNPPVIGAKIQSKFSFQYGRIEIRAQLPQGDWLFPQLNLEPKDYSYGDGYKSGKMWIAYARGNKDLKRGDTGEQIGNSVLYSGPVLDVEDPDRTFKVKTTRSTTSHWGNTYHTFTLLWQPDGIRVSVDNDDNQSISPPYSHSSGKYKDIWITKEAPFDKEFVISLGIGAGGVSDFPEGCTSNGVRKPWKKTSAKATLLFYKVRDTWLPSWSGDKSTLKIDYIRVWSL